MSMYIKYDESKFRNLRGFFLNVGQVRAQSGKLHSSGPLEIERAADGRKIILTLSHSISARSGRGTGRWRVTRIFDAEDVGANVSSQEPFLLFIAVRGLDEELKSAELEFRNLEKISNLE